MMRSLWGESLSEALCTVDGSTNLDSYPLAYLSQAEKDWNEDFIYRIIMGRTLVQGLALDSNRCIS